MSVINHGDDASEALKRCSSYVIGNGKNVTFWIDTSLGDTPLKVQFPRPYKLSIKPTTKIHYMGEWTHDTWIWNLIWRRNVEAFEWEQINSLQL
jgi:hypothetical protein